MVKTKRFALNELEKKQLKNPFGINVHKKLAEYYCEEKMFDKAEEQQEILEYLSRIKRMVKRIM